MPTSSRPVVRTVVALALAAGGLLATAQPAAAVPATATLPTVAVPVAAPRSMVFAHDRLFVTGGDGLTVLGSDGALRSRVADLPGAADALTSATRDRVYVAARGADVIAVVDPTTLAVQRWKVPACPSDLALVGQRLFFSYGCGVGEGRIASVDAGSGGAVVPSGVDDFFYNTPQLAGAGDVLVAGAVGENPAALFSYQASGSTLTRRATNTDTSGLSDVVLSPDGTRLYTAGGYPQDLTNFAATTLVAGPEYETGAWPSGVAVNADGSLVASGTTAPDANLKIFAKGSPEAVVVGSAHPREEYNQPPTLPGTVTFSADGTRVYALVGTAEHTYLTSTSTKPGLVASDLGLAIDQPGAPGAPARLTATLAGRTGATVELRTTTPDGATGTARVVTGADGTARLEQEIGRAHV